LAVANNDQREGENAGQKNICLLEKGRQVASLDNKKYCVQNEKRGYGRDPMYDSLITCAQTGGGKIIGPQKPNWRIKYIDAPRKSEEALKKEDHHADESQQIPDSAEKF